MAIGGNGGVHADGRPECRLGDFSSLCFALMATAGIASALVEWIGPEQRTFMIGLVGALCIAGAGLAAGMIDFFHHRRRFLLWFFIGVHVGLAATAFISYGFASFFITVVVVTWTIRAAKRMGVAAIDGRGFMAEALGFGLGAAPMLLALRS